MKSQSWKAAPGRRPFPDPRPGSFFKSLQQFRRTPEREAGLFESIDDLFDAGYLVIESHDRDVGVLIDFHFLGLDYVCKGPTDPIPGEGSLAVRQQELDDPFLGHGS